MIERGTGNGWHRVVLVEAARIYLKHSCQDLVQFTFDKPVAVITELLMFLWVVICSCLL